MHATAQPTPASRPHAVGVSDADTAPPQPSRPPRARLTAARKAVREALWARAWAVYTLGGGVARAVGEEIGVRVRSRGEDAETSRLANGRAAEKLGDALRAYHRYRVVHPNNATVRWRPEAASVNATDDDVR